MIGPYFLRNRKKYLLIVIFNCDGYYFASIYLDNFSMTAEEETEYLVSFILHIIYLIIICRYGNIIKPKLGKIEPIMQTYIYDDIKKLILHSRLNGLA